MLEYGDKKQPLLNDSNRRVNDEDESDEESESEDEEQNTKHKKLPKQLAIGN